MTKSTVLSDRELLEQFREAYPYFKSIRQIASVPQDDFVRRYAEAAFGCDSRLARRVHQTALHIQEQTALIWANLKDVASPYLQQTLFSNIPQDFLDHQQSIPGYDRLFGSLDFLESDHARSIFGPAAYFVDLLRFVETYITHKEPGAIPPALMLDARRPDLAHIKLDKGATYDLMPYIDLVIEVLENMVRTQENPNAYQVVAAAGFPMNLPFDLPLLEIRTYLKQLKTSLYEIYQCFAPLNGAVDPLAAETLELSPGEYQRIAHEISGEDELTSSYGLAYAGLSDPSALANVKDFLQQTGLSRKELNDLVFQDLDRHEVNAGLSRLFFINNVDDGLGYLMIQQNVDDGLGYLMIQQDENRPLDPSYDSETLVNLSLLKLERIYRFLKLARKLNWSFADLDWAIRSLGELYIPEPSLRFDGLNDAVLCRNVKTDLVVDTFTIEAWVCPQRAGAHPILCKGSKAGQTSQELHFLFWIDAEGRLAFYDKTLLAKDEQRQNDKLEVGYYIRSQQTLPLGAFSHVALTVSGRTVSFYLNGKLAPLAPMYVLDAQAFTALERAGVAQTVRDKLTSLNLDRPLTSAKFAAAIQPAVKPEIGNQQELTNKILEAALITSNLLKGIGGDLDIGGNLDGHFFAGSIKDLRLWQEVLSQTDIETNRYRRLTGSEPNLVGYWPLLESQSKRMDDFTANGHHGILGGAGLATQPVWIHQDLVLDPLPRLQAYHFDGGDQYLAGAAIQGMNQHLSKLTLEAWVMRKAASEQVILCKGQAATNERHFQFGVDAEGLLVFQSNARGATEYKSQTGINLNKWTHLCVTLAERTLTFYVNGALVATEIIPAGLLAPVGDRLQIGRGFAGDPFNGLIREVRIWSTARTAKQILDHMHRPLTQVEGAGLLGYWRLEAVESFTNNGIAHAYARDRSVNRNHLHLGGVLEDYQPTRTPLTAVIAQRPVAAKGAVLAFDGENDLLVIENTDNFGLGRYECWTLELWFKSTTTRRPARKEVIFVQGDVEAGLNLYLDDGKLNVLAWSADYGATNVRQIALSSAPLDLERWHHVAITQDESQALDQVQIKAYLDGALFGEAQNSFPLSPVGAAYLGGMARAGGQLRFDGAYVETATAHPLHHFSGQMADLRLWNRAKRAAEILAGQYIAADSNDPHLAAYLPLDEGEGGTCTDLSTAKELCATQAYTGLMQKHNIVFATGGAGFDLENVYAHYCPDDTVLDWQNYVYTGRMRISDPNGGIGVTFYSRHPAQQDRFYWLRRYAERSTFHLVHHPHNLQTFGVAPIDTGIAPQANTWQRFRIEVEDQLTLGAHGRTSIKVKLWPDGAEEPAAYAVETFDDTQDRISAGTVGLWAFGPGEKHFDDLAVSDLNGAHYLLAESFEVHAADADPVGWRQTSARVQHDLAANLFQTNLVSQQRFFGTNSTVDHIHAHYYPTDQAVNVQTWVSYEYSGCMKMSDEEGGIGVTFFSQFPNRAAYYALRRRADDDAAFQLVGYPNTNEAGGSKLSSLTKDGEVKPAPNRWYRFRIAVTHVPDYRASGQSTPKPTTFIKAKVWPDGQPEPLDYQYEALDDVNPLTAGTVGMWTAGDGAKYFDDLKVVSVAVAPDGQPAPLLTENFEQYAEEAIPAQWQATDGSYSLTVAPELFRIFVQNTKILTSRQDLPTSYESLHTHYAPAGVDVLNWRNYLYSGRIYVADDNSGIGVTFYSRYPTNEDRYYRLQRNKARPAFHLAPHPHDIPILGGAKADAEIVTRPNTWQRFLIDVRTLDQGSASSHTSIRAKVWPEGESEPADFQIEAIDDSNIRLSAGTVGVWASSGSMAYVDDLQVWHRLLDENLVLGPAPQPWQQTTKDYSLTSAADLFKAMPLEGSAVLGTESTLNSIHAHLVSTAVPVRERAAYIYSGRLRLGDEEGGIGVTFFSQFPNRAAYYALRRRADDDAAFQLVGYPDSNEAGGSKLSSLTKDGEVKPAPNRWYRFRIAVTHVPDYRASGQSTPKPTTFIKAKVWPDGQPEPLDYQYEALDDVNPLTAGTVGMWTAGDGAKYFDDLKVYLLDENFEAISVGQRPTDWRDTATRNQYEYISDINLFKTQQFEDNMAHWQTTDQYPLWANPMLLSFDGQRHYLAAAAPPPSPAAPPHTSFTIEAWVYLSQMQENPILSQGESLQRRPDFCFGLDSTGRLTLTQAITGGSLEPIAVGTTLVPVNELTHIALSVTPDQAIFYINGREDSHLPLSSALTLQGPHWEMGSNIADQYFNGYIQEVRLWQTARSAAQLAASAYESPYQLRRKYGNALLAYWPLLETSGIYAHHLAQGSQGMVAGQNMRDPASEAERMTMRLGGLATARYPLRTDDPLRDPGAFWTPDRPVVQFSAAEDIIRISTPPTGGQPVQRRTVEVWFRVADKYLASRKQVIYYEGNEQQGLLIYIFDGQLYFGSYGGPIWAGEWLATNRVASGRWHHAVLVLDGRAEIRPGSLQAFLDGAAVGACRGVELKIAAVSFSLGGIADAASSGIRFHDQAPVAATAKHFLQGQVLELRRWKTALLPQEIHAIWEGQVAGDDSSDPSTLQAGDPAMLEHWWKAEELLNQASNPDGRKQRLGSWPEYPLPHNSLDRAALSNLAAIRTLQAQHGLSVERLCALWYGIKHIGREDGRTLFDEVFNAQANSVRWDYYLQPTRWDVGGQGNLEQDRAIRNRLMGALQLSNANLNVFVATLSGADASVVTLDNDYLGRLYRLVQSARLLRLNVLEYTRLLTILGLQAKPQVSLEDFMQLSARVDWMRRTGIDVAALDFLTNDRSGSGATVTLNEVPLRALATSLRSAAADFLARGESFVSEVISQAQSLAIFTFFRGHEVGGRSVIDEKGAVAAAFAAAPDFAALAATPDWRALLAPLGDSQEWSVALAAELATRLHWKVGLRGGLVALGLDPKRTEADAILQRLQDNGWVSAEGTVREDLLPTAQLLTAALASTNGGQNPIQLPASVTVAKILQFLNDQRNAQQGLLQALRQHDYSNANGVVTENRAIRDSELAQLFTTPQPSAVLAGVREALVQRQAVQTQIGETLLRLRRALDSALVEALAGLFDTDASLTETVFSHFQPQMSSARLIELIFTIEDNQPIAVALAGNPDGYLYKLSKVFFLTAEFGLTMPELGALLATPAIFGVQQVLKPDLADLDSLHAYRELRTALSGSEGVLLDLLIQQNAKSDARLDLIAKLTGWDAAQLQVLAEYFGAANGSRLIWLHRLKACFDLAQAMGADVKFLIQLADIAKDRLSDLPLPVLPDDKETRFFSSAVFTANQQHAAALRNLLMARYDRQQWPSIDRRIHDELAVQQRDALLSQAMLKVGPDYIGRKDADLLYEYLLLDVQMGSVVDASRLQQAIASVQLYVQRCLMNLEKGVQPEWIPQTQWEWMKNYRVWEANRKVFLYPENYIEPELRDSKTPLFAELEQELTQSEINQAAVEKAFTHYLDKFREISNLKIVGSYLHKEFEPEDGPEQQVKSQTLYLIGRTNTQPALFYYREHVQTPLGGSWLPWKKIDLTINADFVTPVYAFNKLFLFWPEFVQQKKSIEPQLSQSILDLYDVDFLNTMFPDPTAGTQTELVSLENELALEPNWGPAYFRSGDLILLIAGKKKLLTRQQAARQALTQELSSGYILKLDEKRWKIGLDGYLINTKTSERINSWIDVYNTTIKYSYYNFSKTWVQPQIYAALNNELAEDVHRDPRWQRLYAQQVVQLTSGGTDQVEKDVRVLHVDQATDIKADLPNFDMNQLTWSFWVRWENRAPGGWLGWKFTITEALKQLWPKDLSTGLSDDVWEAIGKELVKEKPVEITSASLEKTVTLLDYSNEKLYVTATNLVTGITGREAVETAAISTASSTRTALDHTNNNNFTGAATSAAEAEAMALKETFWHAPEIAKLAGYAEQAAKKAAEDIDNANAQASAKAAREAANTANQAAQIARSIEQFRPKWESKSVRLTIRFGQTGETLTVDLAYDVWQQVALVLQKNDQGYAVEVSYVENGRAVSFTASHSFTTPILPSQGQLVVGKQIEDLSTSFATRMSEFRLWNKVRSADIMAQERNRRQTGQEPGLFLLSLNVKPPSATATLLVDSDLSFMLPPVQLARERIILFYGHTDTIKSIRNNLEDQSFDVVLKPATIRPMYDVKLSRYLDSSLDSPIAMLHLTKTASLSFRDFTTGDKKSTILAPVNLSPIPEEINDYLVRKLQEVESSFMDVNNQPGWYILDTGDEQFLVKMLLAKQNGAVPPIPTTRQRLSVQYSDQAGKDTGAPQKLAISFLPVSGDPLMADKPKPQFTFERLSTFAVHELSQNLFAGGIDSLLNLNAQQTLEINFQATYDPNPTLAPREHNQLSNTIDFGGAHRAYYEEIFFHLPFLIANQLNANQQFAEAQKWYHYIFNPTAQESAATGQQDTKARYWRYLPFRIVEQKETLAKLLMDAEALVAYRDDPFDPHAIAHLRLFAYPKAVVMKYIDNLLDWGDSLFVQDTRESITEAAGLYVMAFNLLGPRPKAKSVKELAEIGDYAAIQEQHLNQSIPDFLVPSNGDAAGQGPAVVTPNSNIITTFGLVENEQFIGYWDRVADRLYKIRNSLNIEGTFRQLALFEPPIDPSVLVNAVAGGRGISGALADLNIFAPHYRYAFVVKLAQDMISHVSSLGDALLGALEKRDAEALAALENTHERDILELTTSIKKLECDNAREAIEQLQISRNSKENQHTKYLARYNGGLSDEEIAELVLSGLAQGSKVVAAAAKGVSAVSYVAPDIVAGAAGAASPVALTITGGRSAGLVASMIAEIAEVLAGDFEAAATMTAKIGEHKRRAFEWELEQKTAEFDLQEIDKQIEIAKIVLQQAEADLRIHQKSIVQNREIADFQRSKFSNQALYNWMIARLSGLYFQAYKLAYDTAKAAEKALQFELPTTKTFINYGHWDSLKKGLLAGEALMLELNRMDKFHLDQDSRFQEIEKTISMRQSLPVSLLALLVTGECEFQLSEELFDRDFPGHYFRVIKTIGITLQAPLPTHQSVNASLVQMGNKTLLEPNSDAVRYLLGAEGAEQPSGNVVRTDWRARQQIAMSTNHQDNPDKNIGMFALNFFFDDRYFPFEGTGAVSNWRLEMPKATNPGLDFNQIEDVLIHLRYTSKVDGGAFKKEVQAQMAARRT